jgi:hypothetical protein
VNHSHCHQHCHPHCHSSNFSKHRSAPQLSIPAPHPSRLSPLHALRPPITHYRPPNSIPLGFQWHYRHHHTNTRPAANTASQASSLKISPRLTSPRQPAWPRLATPGRLPRKSHVPAHLTSMDPSGPTIKSLRLSTYLQSHLSPASTLRAANPSRLRLHCSRSPGLDPRRDTDRNSRLS